MLGPQFSAERGSSEMNGIFAQAAALAAHAKASRVDPLLGGDAEYWRRHSTLRFVKLVDFVATRRRLFRSVSETIATEPGEWISRLPSVAPEGVNLVSLGSSGDLPEYVAVAFAGAAKCGVSVESQGVWLATWTLVEKDDPQRRIWSVSYRMTSVGAGLPPAPSIADAREELAAALRETAAFARSASSVSSWCETFYQAERDLERRDARIPYHPDILPPRGYQFSARQLLASAARSWVFGGMGSWNDVWIEGSTARAEHERVTKRLYAAVTAAIMAAVNHGLQ
jgi:hypothetical protein